MKHLSNTNVNSNKLENVPTPVNAGDAVNKAYADTKVGKNTLMYNVKDYGALGNGTTDDTTAIQNALDAAQSAGGGIVFFPAGNYSVFPVYAGAGVSIQGAGNEATIVKRRNQAANNSSSVGAINFHGTSTVPLHRFFVRDITADGNRSGITAGIGGLVDNEAFSFIYARNFTVDSCRGINAPGEGFDLDYCINGTLVNCIGSDNGGNGFHASLQSSRMKFLGNYAFDNGTIFGRAGFDQWTDAADCVYVGNIAESNYQNYKIQGTGAVMSGNKSIGATTVDDVFTGAALSKNVAAIKEGATATIYGDVVEMSGWTWFVGTGANTIGICPIVFPQVVDKILSAQATYLGGVNAQPTQIGDFGGVSATYGPISCSAITNSTMEVVAIRSSGNWAAGWNYGVSWRVSALKKK